MIVLPIAVGIDGSEASLRAVEWAADEAALRGARLRLVEASLWERLEGDLLPGHPDAPYERMRVERNAAVAERRALERRPDVRVTSAVFAEAPQPVLVRESRTATAVVLGCRDSHGVDRAFLGSVGLGVAGHARCPVIVLRGGDGSPPAVPGRIGVGVGGRAGESAAARFALEEATLRGASLRIVRARGRNPLKTAAERTLSAEALEEAGRGKADASVADVLRDIPPGLAVDRRTMEGHAREVLLAVSREVNLIVVGDRRRGEHPGVRLNSVAHALLLHASCPVAVVPEHM